MSVRHSLRSDQPPKQVLMLICQTFVPPVQLSLVCLGSCESGRQPAMLARGWGARPGTSARQAAFDCLSTPKRLHARMIFNAANTEAVRSVHLIHKGSIVARV